MLTASIRTGEKLVEAGTSLRSLLGIEVDSDLLVDKVLESLSWAYFGWNHGALDNIVKRIGSMLENSGDDVVVSHRGKRTVGTVRGVDSTGALVVKLKANDESVRVEAGDDSAGPYAIVYQ